MIKSVSKSFIAPLKGDEKSRIDNSRALPDLPLRTWPLRAHHKQPHYFVRDRDRNFRS